MTHCCSKCSFTAQFESALKMHRQLHHSEDDLELSDKSKKYLANESPNTLPRASSQYKASNHYLNPKESKIFKLPGRTSSATKLFDKLRARICKSKILPAHPEETSNCNLNINDTSILSECTSKAYQEEFPVSKTNVFTACLQDTPREVFGCHLCAFDADRITVLDRHLLNDHKIGLENLLKLVMAKTKDGLLENDTKQDLYGIRQPYYNPPNEIIEEGEFVIETVTPKIKILKHASSNTENQWTDEVDLKDNCQKITTELEKLMNCPIEKCNQDEFMTKMQVLNEYMCKFVSSSNTLKKALKKEFVSKHSVRDNLSLNLSLGDRGTPRDWERAHTDSMENSRNKYADSCRGDKNYSSEKFFF